jgi:probable HAF family extracellular repeat protein
MTRQTRIPRAVTTALLVLAPLTPMSVSGAVGVAPVTAPGVEAVPLGPWLAATPTELGTLGGDHSTAAAIDGDLVVGSAQTETGAWHAFVLDLGSPDPQMVDLGTLGGRHSSATDVSGSVVVGRSAMAQREDGYHLFAYDLSDPETGMMDLGGVGGTDYGADPGPFVDDGLVAGQIGSRSGGSRTVAFSYDLHAAQPRVVRYGALGGRDSAALAVDDGVLVGFAQVPGGGAQAIAVHARGPSPQLVPLGPPDAASYGLDVDEGLVVGQRWTGNGSRALAFDLAESDPVLQKLGGGVGSANAVDAGVVVGSASPSGQQHPAVFDLQSPDTPVVDLGTLGGKGNAVDVDGTTVAGYSNTPAGWLHAFADDLTDEQPMTDLGVPAGYRTARPTDLEASVVVGELGGAGGSRAVVWRLERTDQPLLRFAALRAAVREGTPSVTVTVERIGPSDGPAAVGVSVLPDGFRGAIAGKDHGPVPTLVSFAAGETVASFDVPILQDDLTEPTETIGLQLIDPQGGRLGAGQAMGVHIRASDGRPDLLVRRTSEETWLGEDVYADTATSQTRRWRSPPGFTRTFKVAVCNDPRQRRRHGFVSRFVLHAEAADRGSRTRWFRDRRDVTDTITSAEGLTIFAYTGRCLPLRVTTRIRAGAAIGSLHASTIRADWTGENPATDVVGTEVLVVDGPG